MPTVGCGRIVVIGGVEIEIDLQNSNSSRGVCVRFRTSDENENSEYKTILKRALGSVRRTWPRSTHTVAATSVALITIMV